MEKIKKDLFIKKRFIRLATVREITTLSTSEIYRQIASDSFPKQVKLGPKMVVWLENEIEQWMESIVQKSDVGKRK